MHQLISRYYQISAGVSLLLVLALMMPTLILVVGSVNPDASLSLVFENPLEEEREEERSGGEDEVKEMHASLPLEIGHRDDFDGVAARQHAYQLGAYSSELPIPYLPPEQAV
jgi:hypothetical protein